ncbi:hypothetical protein TanjilG_09385 [Lupinus angustifolius]|uniref:Uncharacterized protein n=1 Tax=Lupinus angustifolius TaxID=3871 RepID=A0A1J7HGQ1_LUPAN|nr:hypothetical protein TanjilG_09385 [Lupinus angustifolius]
MYSEVAETLPRKGFSMFTIGKVSLANMRLRTIAQTMNEKPRRSLTDLYPTKKLVSKVVELALQAPSIVVVVPIPSISNRAQKLVLAMNEKSDDDDNLLISCKIQKVDARTIASTLNKNKRST